MTQNRALNEINNMAPLQESSYVPTDLGIKKTDPETNNLMSATFGIIKNTIEAFRYSTGLDPNVNYAYENQMANEGIEVEGKMFYQHPGVGNLRPYNELGNPSGGCFTLHAVG